MRFPFHFSVLVTLLFATPTLAQTYNVERLPSGQVVVTTNDSYGPLDFPSEYTTVEDAFGSNADGLQTVFDVAMERHPTDQFSFWEKRNASGWTQNSCAQASYNLYDGASQPGVMPPGYEIRAVGTLGTLTNAENGFFNGLLSTASWFDDSIVVPEGYDPLNPPSYAHSLTVVKTDTGEYFTVDTWGSKIEVKQVYPIDENAEFFSQDPNETDIDNSSYRLATVDDVRGRPWDTDEQNEPREDPPEELESEPPPSSDEVEVEVLTSADPNDKYGLLGSGSERYITPDERFYYTIRFENMPDASAPAQEVLVRDTLDASVLDLSTFQLGDIQFGSTRVRVPPGLTSYTTQVPIKSPFVVVISASLVPATGIVTWRFTTLDTNTNDLPFDPLDGFLPPNQNPPEGEGSVSFTIRAKEDLANGTVIRNQARIIFDLNEPIDTPPWVNTIDTAPPMSSVLALSETQSDSVFTVTWGGSDGGSGVGAWDVYVSVDGGAFYQWLRRLPPLVTEETFVGRDGSTYAFYSIATDATGNTEGPKTEAEAVTGVVVSSEGPASGLPLAVELAAPFPNPASAGRTIDVPFALPEAQAADLRVYDVRGREVARLSEGERPAGWHRVEWATRDLAPGVYILRLQTESRVKTRRITVVR